MIVDRRGGQAASTRSDASVQRYAAGSHMYLMRNSSAEADDGNTSGAPPPSCTAVPVRWISTNAPDDRSGAPQRPDTRRQMIRCMEVKLTAGTGAVPELREPGADRAA